MPWTIKPTRNRFQAVDAERGIELSSSTREALDAMIAKLDNPAPARTEEANEPYTPAPVSREAEAAALRYWTGRGPLPVAPQQDSIQARFERFHATNPHIYARLVEAARRLRDSGKMRIGIGHLVEDCIRWAEERTTGENWKISNDYRSRYARKIMDENPELAGIFEIRQLESE